MTWVCNIDEVLNSASFVYLITFPKTKEFYIGVKQVYVKVRNSKKIKPHSKQSNWMKYNSSSTTVKNKIAAGEECIKTILCTFPDTTKSALVETILIAYFGTRPNSLNKALMVKTSLQKDDGEQLKIITELIERVSEYVK